MIDFEQILTIAKSQGYSQKQFAAKLELSPGQVWRLKTGRNKATLETLSRAVNILGIGEGDVSRDKPDWIIIAKDDLTSLTTYNEQLRRAGSVLTITNSIDSYLQDEWMLEWSNRIWSGIDDWEAHSKFFYPYARQQVAVRNSGGYWHRLVCPWNLLISARVQNIGWLDQIRRGLGNYEEVCAVTPIREWSRLYSAVSDRLPPKAANWGKICVIDSVRIMVHVTDQFYVSCSHEPTAKQVNKELDLIVKSHESTFLRESEITLQRLKESSMDTHDRIENLLRSRDDLNRAFLYWEAFDRMMEEKANVRPRKFCQRRPKPK